MINYDLLATNFEEVRSCKQSIGLAILMELDLGKNYVTLDFGCGTGNYLNFLSKFGVFQLYGIEPSSSMMKYAQIKNPSLTIKRGNHKNIPYGDEIFDFIYMIDVVHHIKETSIMFTELGRVLKPGGHICICTESKSQIERKSWYNYFPSAKKVDSKRFHPIEALVQTAQEHGFAVDNIYELNIHKKKKISKEFLYELKSRTISVLQLISDEEYLVGLANAFKDFEDGKKIKSLCGWTLIWMSKTTP